MKVEEACFFTLKPKRPAQYFRSHPLPYASSLAVARLRYTARAIPTAVFSMPPPATLPTGEIFLSYSRSDRVACIALRSALEQAGFPVFRDEDSIRCGDRWLTSLQKALLGCSAFVLLVGRDGVQRWVGAEVEVALSRHLSPADGAQRLPIFPLFLEGAEHGDLPPFLALFQAARWSADEPLPEALLAAITSGATLPDYRETFDGCPFLGLRAFARVDARLFFGRRMETLEALACLGDQREANPERLQGSAGAGYQRWLQIEGNSGAGKSSLVNAGMLPMIERGALWARTGFEHWRLLGPMMPGLDPLAKLADVLEHALIAEPAQRDVLRLQQRFERNERALASRLRDLKQERTAFLLIVDQFEELFTFAGDAPRKQFDALLAQALHDPECPLFLISTVRADFLDRFEQLPRLRAIYNSHCRRYFLPTISENGLREVIEQPAALAGLDVREVATAILDDARDEMGALPLVENALFTLWQRRDGNRLSGQCYRDENGIVGILSTQADELLARIEADVAQGRRAALELLLRLTRINDEGRHTRQRITREEAILVAGNGRDEIGERVLQLLSGERQPGVPSAGGQGALRLITTSLVGKQRYVDLIHETLIRARGKDATSGKRIGYWPTLYDYIEANRDRDIHRRQLGFQTEQWLKSGGIFARWRNLAGWRDLGLYRRLRVVSGSDEGRFLAASRWNARVQVALLALLLSFVGESYLWTRRNDLPLDSMLMQQRYRLGYAPLPELVDIPAGSVDIGEQDEEFVKGIPETTMMYLGVPGRRVEITSGFSLGKYEVTYEQFDYYVWEQQRTADRRLAHYPTAAKGGRGKRPVVNVDWSAASDYTRWLGERIGRECRLPTEAEWEHAARAKTHTAYPWGDEVRRMSSGREDVMANCRGCGSSWDGDQSAPVGSFAANAFGVHDNSGNVWEWTCSVGRERFDGSEQTCAAGDRENTEARVVRGGSWNDVVAFARSAARFRVPPDLRFDFLGFRVWCSSQS